MAELSGLQSEAAFKHNVRLSAALKIQNFYWFIRTPLNLPGCKGKTNLLINNNPLKN